MAKETDEGARIQAKELMLRESLDGYISTVGARLDAFEKREELLRKLVSEQKKSTQDVKEESGRILEARGRIIKELLKKDQKAVQTLLVQVIKEMQLTKEEAKKVLTD